MSKTRLDVAMAAQGLAESRQKAQAIIMSGLVFVDGKRVDKCGAQIADTAVIEVRGKTLRYVSRGGLKLERGLEALGVDPRGLSCLDVGCSTGGFTDCLLRRGAARVLAVDVGYAQFDWSLRQDDRVELLERTNARDLVGTGRDGTVDLAVCDVSFTSVTAILPAVMALLKPSGSFLTLVKQQFECARERVGAGGIVRDADARLWALERVASAFASVGLGVRGACASPITGAKGNHEYLMLGTRGADAVPVDLSALAVGD